MTETGRKFHGRSLDRPRAIFDLGGAAMTGRHCFMQPESNGVRRFTGQLQGSTPCTEESGKSQNERQEFAWCTGVLYIYLPKPSLL
ncbi:hypothetical protein KL938_003949 [Ogataea parapolymorpha]|nr:hypothetical protein KL938_003949 [Ogataea parapolymorpha]